MFSNLGSRAGAKAAPRHASRWARGQGVRTYSLKSGEVPDFGDYQILNIVVNGGTFTVPNPLRPPPLVRPDEARFVVMFVKFSTANALALGNKFKSTGYTASTSGVDQLTFLYDQPTDLYGLFGFRNNIFA